MGMVVNGVVSSGGKIIIMIKVQHNKMARLLQLADSCLPVFILVQRTFLCGLSPEAHNPATIPLNPAFLLFIMRH